MSESKVFLKGLDYFTSIYTNGLPDFPCIDKKGKCDRNGNLSAS